MALADYSTSAEKIAALKAAMIDPSLIQMATSNFTTTENIYDITKCPYVNGMTTVVFYDNNSCIPSITPTGSILTDITEHTMVFLYIKDSDIVYPDPISTYQNRLANIIESELITENSYATVDAGANGSMVKSLGNHGYLYINSRDSGVYMDTPIPLQIVIPNGNEFESHGSYAFTYIDLPADW